MPSSTSTRATGARSPSPTRQAPRNRPLVPMQRPPNKHLTAFLHSAVAAPVPAPPGTNCPPSMQRSTRSEASMPCQRPPRTEAPAPGLITPPSPLVSTRSDYPCSLQRPPRIKAPLPMDRTCSGDPAVMTKRPQNTEHSVPLQRPPRIKLTAANVEPPASFQIPIKRVALVQRPPRTNPPCPIIRTGMAECPDQNDASAKTISNVDGAKSTVGHNKGVPAVTGLENSNKKDLSNPESDHEKTSPGFQAPLKSLEVAEAASLLVEADFPEDVSLVQPRQPNEKEQRDLSESDELEDDIGLFIPMEDQDSEAEEQKKKKGRMSLKRKREDLQGESEAVVSSDLDNSLDRCLEDRAKLHNLTAVNVRNILHEVITNEHVVAMMKAAITDTQDLPIFEPKMTRSKLKEVVEKGVVIPTWNLSPIKKVGELKVPQFVDIPLEEEDSSDEEYRPDDEDEDETAEESLLESDVESTASSPRGHKRPRVHCLSEPTEEEEAVECPQAEKVATEITKHVDSRVTLMGPPPPPSKIKCTQDSTFMAELHAVDEELNSSMVCMDSYQTMDSLIAFRTRSKRPLKDVRIGQLEAKLNAPDITPDMYDPNTADDEDWKLWLQSLMQDDVGNEDEADDDDDPEYNFLEDMDEPDTEDLRNDRAVRITKKEVSELMEELFETFQDEMGYSNLEEDEDSSLEVSPCKAHMEEEETEDDDSQREAINNFNTPQAIRFEEPLANILNEQHRTIKAHLQFLRMKKSVLKSSAQDEESKDSHTYQTKAAPVFPLDAGQKKRLQQQMQQHVQLLTQVHLLTFRNPRLNSEAETTRMFLVELSNFAENSALVHHTENLTFQSAFHTSNLKDAIELLNGVQSKVPESPEQPQTRKNVSEIPCLPTDIAWVLATQPVFMYPELLPVCGLKARGPRARVFFTKAEDSLLALGLKHFEGTEFTKTLISKYLVPAKTSQQLNARIKNLTMNKSPDNIVKYYKKTKSLPATVKCCDVIQSYDGKPPVEREKHRLPYWLKASLTSIETETEKLEKAGPISGNERPAKYPLLVPPELKLCFKPLPKRYYFKAWRHKRPALQPLLIRPNGSINSPNKHAFKQHSVVQSVPITILSGIPSFIQSSRPVQGFVGVNPVNPLSGEVRSSHLSSTMQPAVVSPFPVLQNKMTLPLTSLRVQKPRTKSLLKNTCSRSTPPIQAPVLFSVPSGALKLVNLSTSCGVIQPLGARRGIPVTTVLLNPSSAPINQTLLTSNLNQTIYDVSTVIPEDQSSVVLETVTSGSVKPEEPIKPFMDTGGHDHVWDCVSITIKVEEGGGSAVDGETNPAGEEETTNSGDRSSVVEGCSFHNDNERPPSESKPVQGDSCSAGLGFCASFPDDMKNRLEFQSDTMRTFQTAGIQSPKEPEVKKDLKEFNVGVSDSLGTQFVKNMLPGNGEPLQPSMKEENVIEKDTDTCGSSRSRLFNAMVPMLSESDCPVDPVDISQSDSPADPVTIAQPYHVRDLRDLVHPAEPAALPRFSRSAEPVDFATDRPAEPEDVQDENTDKTDQQCPVLEAKERDSNGSHIQDAGVQGESSQNIPTSVECHVDMGGPSESPHEPSNLLGQQQGNNEKDIPEDEEEEDFDDLTQDEDEEEMSSASEESVLSVPELQETMEKLTWLASERRLSQEGDSEENSQEENSEPEEEEEEEVEGTDSSMRKEEEMTDEVTTEITTPAPSHPHIPSPVPMEHVATPAGEGRKGGSKGRTTHRVRSRRGRARTSKDASKLLLLYDENILLKDPLREQKDMAFAQEYLNRVRDALQAMPGKYEQFLNLIYQFENNKHTKTAVDLYENLRDLLCGWPQLTKDFAAFLLPEQALECGLFQEQQAFEKSRKFLRQLEICFLENPAQHQKIIKLLQSIPDCSLEEISKLKAQMWQLLKGHNHLQEEFSVFFDHLRPPSSRMGEFEVLNWIEDKEYKFDGFEEVSLPDVDDEEEVSKVHPPQRGKRKKEAHQGQEVDWLDGGKDCPCSCHEVGGGEQRLKRCKRRMCNHCSTKVCENRVYRSRETPEVASGGPQGVVRNGPPGKEVGNCEGRLSFPKGTAAADRLAAGGKGTNVTKGSSTSEYVANTSKSRTASQSRSATMVDSTDYRSQKPHAKDRPGLSHRNGRKSTVAKGPDPIVQSEKAVESSSHQPYSPPLPSASSSITTAGEDAENLTECAPSSPTQKTPDSVSAVDLPIQEKKKAPTPHTTKCSEKEEQMLTVCAKNITVSSSGEKVILWTREADRVILTMCQERGAQDETFAAISSKLGNKSPEEVCQRFKELVNLFQAACATSSDDEEEATEQISDLEAPHSEDD